ncbi:MAG: replicative DNA helicase [Myxococcales bacterium]|nr:replicative DNA helicase [Myxococcales bacterium]
MNSVPPRVLAQKQRLIAHPSLQLPQNNQAELSLLGGIVVDNQAIARVLELVGADDFYREGHRQIFQATVELFNRGIPCDFITLTETLQNKGWLDSVGGPSYISALMDYVTTTANLVQYAQIVRDKAMMRRMIEVTSEIALSGYEEQEDVSSYIDEAESKVFAVGEQKMTRSFSPMSELVGPALQTIEELYTRKEAVTGLPTGFERLDQMLSGLQSSDLIILAARPSMGKTALALNLCANAALRSGKAVAIFSLEMSKQQLVNRMLCSEARLDASKLRTGYLAESDWPRLTKAAASLAEAPVFIDDTPAVSVLEMRAKVRRLAAERELGLIMVDYLQLMRGSANTHSREQEISEISRSLKGLAKELSVPMLALSQLNRSLESRTDKRPILSDLRESGAIEQDADVIMFIYRDEVYNKETERKGIAEIIIGKQRNGPIGFVPLKFFHSYTRFENLADEFD